MSDNGRHRFTGNIFFPAAPPVALSGWRKLADRILRPLGSTWRSAPIRRLIQVLCLALYLYLFFYVAWPYATFFSSRTIADKQHLPLQTFLWIDPLVGFSTVMAARALNVALIGAAAILLLGVLIPRAFCGYLCPLGTLIDAFDWLATIPFRHLRAHTIPRWAHLRFYLLIAVLAASAAGALLSGYVSAIPVLTRGLLFTAGRLQLGLGRNWSMLTPADVALYLSIALFALIFLGSVFSKRFWCRYLCPSGALLSLSSLLRLTDRTVSDSCTSCGQCARICPFDAINPDFTTRTLACTTCQTCAGVCSTHSINFVPRSSRLSPEPQPYPTPAPIALSRRGMLLAAVAGAGGLAAGCALHRPGKLPIDLLRPPGSVPEDQFLALCIRCGECFKVCPGPVLHPAGLESGLNALWTPVALPTHAGCHQDCNFCTQVCPTHAICSLTLEQKRKTKMGLAVIDTALCLPHRGERDCQLCFDECKAAGYSAIQMREIKLTLGERPPGVSEEQYEEMGRITAPFVDAAACTGCGLCEYRCHTLATRHQLPRRAIQTTPKRGRI